MFRGTQAWSFRRPPTRAPWRAMARDDNAFTTEDYTAFYEQIARDRLKIAMALEADRMAHLDLSDAAVTHRARRGAGRTPHAHRQ